MTTTPHATNGAASDTLSPHDMHMMHSPPTELPFLDKNPSGNDTDLPSLKFYTPADDAMMTDVSQTPLSLMPPTDTTSPPSPCPN
jgi:hypothetical protein